MLMVPSCPVKEDRGLRNSCHESSGPALAKSVVVLMLSVGGGNHDHGRQLTRMNGSTDLRRESLYTQMERDPWPGLHRRQSEGQLSVQADEPEMHQFNDPRRPLV